MAPVDAEGAHVLDLKPGARGTPRPIGSAVLALVLPAGMDPLRNLRRDVPGGRRCSFLGISFERDFDFVRFLAGGVGGNLTPLADAIQNRHDLDDVVSRFGG